MGWEVGQARHNIARHIRIKEGEIGGNQLIEERATQAYRPFLAMDKVKGRIGTNLRIGKVCRRSFIPCKATACSIP